MTKIIELKNKIQEVVIQASILAHYYFLNKNYNVWYKKENENYQSPCTSVDILIHNFLCKKLHEIFPLAFILSEENTDSLERLKKEWVWIIDPIDGTQDFISGRSEYSISIALIQNKKNVLGVVALPSEKTIIIGAPNFFFDKISYDDTVFTNALVNENQEIEELLSQIKIPYQEFKVNTLQKFIELKNAKILVSRGELRQGKLDFIKDKYNCVESSSIARKLALLTLGQGDLVISVNFKNEWDIAGGIALINGLNEYKVIELKNLNEHNFNQENTKSFGIVAGAKNLVEEFVEVWTKKLL